MKLFVLEYRFQIWRPGWEPIQFWLSTFRHIVDCLSGEYLCQPDYRVRRVQTWVEAQSLENIDNIRMQLPMNMSEIEWVA